MIYLSYKAIKKSLNKFEN